MGITKSPWLVCSKPNVNAVARIICLPYAGGSATTFHDWYGDISNNIEVVTVQYPGRGARFNETPISDMGVMVGELVKQFRTLGDKPFFIFGHSLGGRIAYELTVALAKNGYQGPRAMLVSGCGAPHLLTDESSHFIQRLRIRNNVQIYDLDRHDFIEELRILEGTPEEVLKNDELLDLVIPSLRADFKLARNYDQRRAAHALSCPIVALGGREDTSVSLASVAAWRELTRSSFNLIEFAGGHFFLHDQHAKIIVELNRALLAMTGDLYNATG